MSEIVVSKLFLGILDGSGPLPLLFGVLPVGVLKSSLFPWFALRPGGSAASVCGGAAIFILAVVKPSFSAHRAASRRSSPEAEFENVSA
jgi:hypothetical protein